MKERAFRQTGSEALRILSTGERMKPSGPSVSSAAAVAFRMLPSLPSSMVRKPLTPPQRAILPRSFCLSS